MELSCAHRVCLSLVLLGLLLQAAMFCAPYWVRIQVLSNVYTATLGPLITCSPQNVFGATECNLINFDKNFSKCSPINCFLGFLLIKRQSVWGMCVCVCSCAFVYVCVGLCVSVFAGVFVCIYLCYVSE